MVGGDGGRHVRHKKGDRQRQRAAGSNVDGGRQQRRTMTVGEDNGVGGQWGGIEGDAWMQGRRLDVMVAGSGGG